MKVILLVNSDIGALFVQYASKIVSIQAAIFETMPQNKSLLNDNQVRYIQYNTPDFFFFIKNINFDCIISYNWNRKLSPSFCECYECYNFHFSLLPKHRGPIPLVFCILNREDKTGVTLHKIDKNYDSGDIINQKSFLISEKMNFTQLNLKCLQTSIYICES